MCWTSDTNPIPKTADKDIICYKVFYIKDIKYKIRKFLWIPLWKEGIEKLYSMYEEYEYVPYATNPKVNIRCKKRNGIYSRWAIDKGYHSYSTLSRAAFVRCKISRLIVECTIPKGSVYYLNGNNEIVSSNIIVTDKIVG